MGKCGRGAQLIIFLYFVATSRTNMTEPTSKPRSIRGLNYLYLFIVSLALITVGNAITSSLPHSIENGDTDHFIIFVLGQAIAPFFVGTIFMFWRKSIAAGYIAMLICTFMMFYGSIANVA